jgi:hypothetical protein
MHHWLYRPRIRSGPPIDGDHVGNHRSTATTDRRRPPIDGDHVGNHRFRW